MGLSRHAYPTAHTAHSGSVVRIPCSWYMDDGVRASRPLRRQGRIIARRFGWAASHLSRGQLGSWPPLRWTWTRSWGTALSSSSTACMMASSSPARDGQAAELVSSGRRQGGLTARGDLLAIGFRGSVQDQVGANPSQTGLQAISWVLLSGVTAQCEREETHQAIVQERPMPH